MNHWCSVSSIRPCLASNDMSFVSLYSSIALTHDDDR